MRSSMLVLLLFLSGQAVAVAAITRGHPEPQRQTKTPTPSPSWTRSFSPSADTTHPECFSALTPDAEPSEPQRVNRRSRRQAEEPWQEHRGEYSVCDSVSVWVGNKTKATDILGHEVTVLPDVNINNVKKKQYFFETTCNSPHSGRSSCLGIDARHWNSYCTNSHTFVRALTSFKNLVAWRLIRINVACVCVLSRKSWRP